MSLYRETGNDLLLPDIPPENHSIHGKRPQPPLVTEVTETTEAADPRVQGELKPQELKSQRALLADGEETVARIPAVAEPVEAQPAVAGVAPEETDVAVALRVGPDGAEGHDRELALSLGVLGAEGEQLDHGGRAQAQAVHLGQHFLVGGDAVQADEDGLDRLLTRTHREVLRDDVGVGVVVATTGHHIGQGLAVVDGEREGGSGGLVDEQLRYTTPQVAVGM